MVFPDYLQCIMVFALQIFFVLLLIVVVALFAFSIRRKRYVVQLTDKHKAILLNHVKFFQSLNEEDQLMFEKRVAAFLSSVKITGVNAEIEDADRIYIAAGAIIPVFRIPDWQYINLHEVLVYPGSFNMDFDQDGWHRNISGMVGSGALQHVMVINKWQLRQGFLNYQDMHNTAIHEFSHLIDKMDGSIDGIPEIIMDFQDKTLWKQIMESTIQQMRMSGSEINPYAATNNAEFFAVLSEYFFEQPEMLRTNHPNVYSMLARIYRTAREVSA